MPDIRPDPDKLRARRENDAERRRALDRLNTLARMGDDVIDDFLIVLGLDELWPSASSRAFLARSGRFSTPRAPRPVLAALGALQRHPPARAGRSGC